MSSLERPVDGRRISGVALLLARRCGVAPLGCRVGFVLLALAGWGLALAAGVFDHALVSAGLSDGVRLGLVSLGVLLGLSYPLAALFLPEARHPRRWDFGAATGALVCLLAIGQAVGFLIKPYWDVARAAWQRDGLTGLFTWGGEYVDAQGFGAKDLVLLLFFFSSTAFLWLQRDSVKRYFRSMTVGVTTVTAVTLAVGAGVLIPQIDGFEDPDQRVDPRREHADYLIFKEEGYQKLPASMQDGHEQYQAFRWAEGYFIYHLIHLYGIGMPEADLLPRMEEGLERFGQKYGREEARNREKQMKAAFTGQEKLKEIGAFIHRNEDTFWRFFQASTILQLNRIYKSNWFATLLLLLAIAVGFNTFRGKASGWIRAKKLGFFTVHMGILTLLLGGLVSNLFTDRGILELDLLEAPRDVYARHYDRSKPARLPFRVGLEAFARKDWPALVVAFADGDLSSRPPRYTLWEERALELDLVQVSEDEERPRLRIEVEELFDRAEVGLPLVSEGVVAPGQVAQPLAEMVATTLDDAPDTAPEERRFFLFPFTEPFPQILREKGFRLVGHFGPGSSSLFPRGQAILGRLEARVRGVGDGEHASHSIELGSKLELEGGYTLRVVDATADFRPPGQGPGGEGYPGTGDRNGSRHPLPLAEQPLGRATIWVDIQGPDGGEPERRMVFGDFDAVQFGLQSSYFHETVELRMVWDEWRSPGPARYVLAWGDGSPLLWSEDGEATPVVAGEPLELPGRAALTATQLLTHAERDKNFVFHPRSLTSTGWDEDFYSPAPRGVVLNVVEDPGTPDERAHEVRLASTEFANYDRWFSHDGTFALYFLENKEMLPFEWRSVLTIWEPDGAGDYQEVDLGPPNEREIRVNDYFYYGGYRFFQSSANPELPSYSGIGVVYDPGIPLVLAGMYTIIVGTLIAFLIRPIMQYGSSRGRA